MHTNPTRYSAIGGSKHARYHFFLFHFFYTGMVCEYPRDNRICNLRLVFYC